MRPVEFKVSRVAVKMSGLINDMLEGQPDAEQIVIPIPNVGGRTLGCVVQYMEHHHDKREIPLENPLLHRIEDLVDDWDRNFLFGDLVHRNNERKHDLLIDVIMAANFLKVKQLLELTCACVASMIKNKTPAEIRLLFDIEQDFTLEEEAKISDENKWCEEPAV